VHFWGHHPLSSRMPVLRLPMLTGKSHRHDFNLCLALAFRCTATALAGG
jgi:hypothetical protein